MTSRTPYELLSNFGNWETRWNWNPGAANTEHESAVPLPDNKDLDRRLDDMEQQVKMYKAQAAAAQRSEAAMKRDRASFDSDGANSGGGSSNKGKGGGQKGGGKANGGSFSKIQRKNSSKR